MQDHRMAGRDLVAALMIRISTSGIYAVYGLAMKKIMVRIQDFRHEQKITAAGRAYDKARRDGVSSKDDLVKRWNRYVDLINARSASQVGRMERRMGIG